MMSKKDGFRGKSRHPWGIPANSPYTYTYTNTNTSSDNAQTLSSSHGLRWLSRSIQSTVGMILFHFFLSNCAFMWIHWSRGRSHARTYFISNHFRSEWVGELYLDIFFFFFLFCQSALDIHSSLVKHQFSFLKTIQKFNFGFQFFL